MELEYVSELECRYREAVVYPRAARRAMIERELGALPRRPSPPARRRTPGRLIEGLMLRTNNWLGGTQRRDSRAS